MTMLAGPAALDGYLAQGGAAALVTDAAAPPPGFVAAQTIARRPLHRALCGCCGGRSEAAIALDRLFQARARGHAPWFGRVAVLVASPALRRDLEAAISADALTMARFRAA
ncbi:hypothetical protein [Roseomonas sp. CECT 9278]|uniref:hypothetical protein n=1 Tax=Roseomonas sp. CECT 9278 TaxID=2845823 RepID=UPI001E3DC4A5|nr:hypothetical protein [Roseomonas sp. CECT 9278]